MTSEGLDCAPFFRVGPQNCLLKCVHEPASDDALWVTGVRELKQVVFESFGISAIQLDVLHGNGAFDRNAVRPFRYEAVVSSAELFRDVHDTRREGVHEQEPARHGRLTGRHVDCDTSAVVPVSNAHRRLHDAECHRARDEDQGKCLLRNVGPGFVPAETDEPEHNERDERQNAQKIRSALDIHLVEDAEGEDNADADESRRNGNILHVFKRILGSESVHDASLCLE